VKEIPLTNGKVALVSDEDYEWLSKYKWRYHNGYAARTVRTKSGKRTTVLMHREIMNATNQEVDHIDGNKLNNTRENLRIATRLDNCRNVNKKRTNTSGYKGVSFDKRRGKWRARIKVNYKEVWLGYFDNKHDAARMYNFWAKDLFGEYARLNVIREDEEEIA
jgi:hypothetical protein